MSTYVAKITIEEVVEPNVGANRARGITAGRHKILEIEIANPTYPDLLEAVAGHIRFAADSPPTLVPKGPTRSATR